MLRTGIFAFVIAFAATAAAEEAPSPAARQARDPFVISSDACGASQYQHLVNQPLAQVQHASLPTGSKVIAVEQVKTTTLEYTPARLNVVVGAQGTIVAISCF